MKGGLALVALVLAYTLAGGPGPGSRRESPPPPVAIVYTLRMDARTWMVTVRNNQTYALRGEVEGLKTPLLEPGREHTLIIELPEASQRELSAREHLEYFDDAEFDRSRVTPADVWQLEESE